jgi:arginyl-tRNA synthetase
MSDSVRATARDLLLRAVQATQQEGLLSEVPSQIPVERPKRPEHGDYATNVALSLAKAAGKSPRVLGEAIAKHLRLIGDANLAEVTVAGPGFVNLRFSATWDWRRTAARLAWVKAIRQVLETALSLLGVSAPQEMKRAETTDEAEEP